MRHACPGRGSLLNLAPLAENVIWKFRESLEKHHHETSSKVEISFSCGIVEFDPEKQAAIEHMLAMKRFLDLDWRDKDVSAQIPFSSPVPVAARGTRPATAGLCRSRLPAVRFPRPPM